MSSKAAAWRRQDRPWASAVGGNGLSPDIQLTRPYLPETPQENGMDNNSSRLQGLEKRS